MYFGVIHFLVPAMCGITFLIAVILCGVAVGRGFREWHASNRSPVLVIEAKIVSKRQELSRRHNHSSPRHMGHAATSHYVTFEAETGNRIEFHVGGSEYGMLAEGDWGRLTFQGTRYLGFQRRGGNG